MRNFSIHNYKPEIDSLRAIAVFLVILFHFELFMVGGGFIGVDIFLNILSGTVIIFLTDINKAWIPMIIKETKLKKTFKEV